MMLRLAKNQELTDIVSDGDMSNPIETQHPIEGSSVETVVYLFNDDETKRYEDVSVTATDDFDIDESGWIEFSLDGETFSSSVQIGNVEEANAGVPITVRVTTPELPETQNKTDIKITVNYTEFAV